MQEGEQQVRHVLTDVAGEFEFFEWALSASDVSVSPTPSRRENAAESISSLPASILEKSRMSLKTVVPVPHQGHEHLHPHDMPVAAEVTLLDVIGTGAAGERFRDEVQVKEGLRVTP